VDDLGIVKAIQKAYGLRKPPDAKRMLKIAEPWRPYRSVASWYLWASLDNKPKVTSDK
jgi:DNA-3-methyladenine glycosylase II